MTFPPARLHCILSDNKVLSMSLSKSGVSEPVPLLCQENSREIKGQFKEPFDKHIANLLQRSTNNPLIKSSNSTLSMEECYEILARSNKGMFINQVDMILVVCLNFLVMFDIF